MMSTLLVHSPGEHPRLVRGCATNYQYIAGYRFRVEVWSAESWAHLPEEERPLRAQAIGECWLLITADPLPTLFEPVGETVRWRD